MHPTMSMTQQPQKTLNAKIWGPEICNSSKLAGNTTELKNRMDTIIKFEKYRDIDFDPYKQIKKYVWYMKSFRSLDSNSNN
jgi:hypothetical protein